MAKYYGIGGKRKGSVGNETYAINRGQNIVKSKIIQVNDAKTPEQVEQRSKLQNAVKAYQNIGSEFLSKCFEDKKQRQSTYNAFVSHNAKVAEPFFKKFSDDKNIIGIGNFQITNGSLSNLVVEKSQEVTIDEKKYVYYGINLGAEIEANSNVGAVSQVLMTKHGIKEGSVLNGLSIYNEGVAYKADNNEPLELGLTYSVKKSKQNFVVDSKSNATLASKGFKLQEDGTNKFLILLEEGSNVKIAEGCIYSTTNAEIGSIGYCAYFVSLKDANKILVSTSFICKNKGLEDLVTAINANPQMLRGWLATTMKILIIMSYGIKKVIEIIRDWPI